MTTTRARIISAGDGVRSWWNQTFFTEESTSSVAVVRILIGLLIVAWALSVTPDVTNFFGADPIAPPQSLTNGRWSLLTLWDSDGAAILFHILLIVSGVAITLGWHTRLATAVALIVLISLTRKNPYILNSGDTLIRNIALLSLLAPGGLALSVTAQKKFGTIWAFPHRMAWPRRLMQVQLSVIYLATVVEKLAGADWQDGTAVGYALRIGDLIRFPTPDFVFDSLLLVNLLTFGTLVVEFALGVLIWNKRLRPWILLSGVLLHVSIDLTLTVGFFSYGVLILYAAFIEPADMEAFINKARDWMARRLAPVTTPVTE